MPIDVTDSSFQSAVLDESSRRPVLVDFWAEWCGPCRMIGPVLEKMESEMGGKFLLAKLDTDRNQATAVSYGIQSIPAVKLFVNRTVADEFMGALPEARVRDFLERNIPDSRIVELQEMAKADPIAAGNQVIEQSISSRGYTDILWAATCAALRKDDMELSEQIGGALFFLEAIPETGSDRSDARRWLLSYLQSEPGETGLDALRNVLTEGQEEAGLEALLQAIAVAPAETRAKAKDGILAAFQILGNDSELANRYRRKLASVLY